MARSYTFKDVIAHTSYNAPPGVVPTDITPSGSDPEEMAERLAKAIMSGDSTVTATVEADTASPPLMAKVRVKVRQPGTAGNAYTLTETGSSRDGVWSDVHRWRGRGQCRLHQHGQSDRQEGAGALVRQATPVQPRLPLMARDEEDERESGRSKGKLMSMWSASEKSR